MLQRIKAYECMLKGEIRNALLLIHSLHFNKNFSFHDEILPLLSWKYFRGKVGYINYFPNDKLIFVSDTSMAGTH